MSKSPKMSPNLPQNPKVKAAYMKSYQYRRAMIQELEQKGYFFPKNPLPEIPEVITEESIKSLRSYTKQTLLAKAQFIGVTPLGGIGTASEPLSGLEAYRQELQSNRLGTEPMIAENAMRDLIDNFTNIWRQSLSRKHDPAGLNWLEEWMHDFERAFGTQKLAGLLLDQAPWLSNIKQEEIYNESEMRLAVAKILTLLPFAEQYNERAAEELELTESFEFPQ